MKILAISDIHGKKNENLINYLKEEDISLVHSHNSIIRRSDFDNSVKLIGLLNGICK